MSKKGNKKKIKVEDKKERDKDSIHLNLGSDICRKSGYLVVNRKQAIVIMQELLNWLNRTE